MPTNLVLVVYGMGQVRRLCGYSSYVSGCGKSTIKVRQKYAESKAYVWLKYSKSTVLYRNFFLAPTVIVRG